MLAAASSPAPYLVVIHVAVGFGMVAGIVGIAYAVRPPWRPRLYLPLVGMAALTALLAVVSRQTGRAMWADLERRGTLDISTLDRLSSHMVLADLAIGGSITFFVVVVVLTLTALPRNAPEGYDGGLFGPSLAVSCLITTSLCLIVFLALCAASGAEGTWWGSGQARSIPAVSSAVSGESVRPALVRSLYGFNVLV